MFEKLEELAKNNKKISDFHIRSGWPLAYRQTGEIHKIQEVVVKKQDLQDRCYHLLPINHPCILQADGILEVDKYDRKNDYTQYSNQEFHFSTFGFCLPNKGFIELILAIKILHNMNINCRLTLYTSLYDDSISHELFNTLKLLIDDLKLNKYVHINPSFLSDEEIIRYLSSSDLVIFPYQSTNESASGAVRQGITSLAPVAVTPVPIFDDVLDVVYQLPGCSSTSIADGLIQWINDCYGLPMNQNEINWRKQHSFKILSCRLQGIIRSLEINY